MLNRDYFYYLIDTVLPENDAEIELLKDLSEEIYEPKSMLDKAWASKGLWMRNGYFEHELGLEMGRAKHCTMLEMLIVLAKDVDNLLEWDPDLGSQLPKFFWIFVYNMRKFEDETGLDACENYEKSIFFDAKRREKLVTKSIWKQANDYFFD